jgi:hypothetical protein
MLYSHKLIFKLATSFGTYREMMLVLIEEYKVPMIILSHGCMGITKLT